MSCIVDAGVLDQLLPRLHGLRAGVDQASDLVRGLRRTLRQRAHFGGNDRKALAMRAGSV
jgi:hypothetical protein